MERRKGKEERWGKKEEKKDDSGNIEYPKFIAEKR